MDDYSATIIVKSGEKGALITFGYAENFQAVQTFAGVLHTMTTADIVRCTFTQATNPQLTGNGQPLADPSYAALFKLRRTDPQADVRYKKFRLPAPRLDMFEAIQGQGYRIKDSYGNTLAAAYSALTGENFMFDSGWLVN